MKKIGILTSGGDAPGMNAVIRAVVRSALSMGMDIMGIERGYDGLLDDEMVLMDRASVGEIMQRGGTILKTACSQRFTTEEGRAKALKILQLHGIESLIVCGGDGSFKGALELSKLGMPVIGIPCTIDNDMGYTDYTIGFDTSVNTVLDAVGKIRDTASSHDRTTIIEVMGRDCGDIAAFAGVAGGAESVLVPEIKSDVDAVCRKIVAARDKGKRHSIIIRAEGADIGTDQLADTIYKETGSEARKVVLAYVQRGGSPTMMDRLRAAMMGHEAVKLIAQGNSNMAVGVKDDKVFTMDLEKAINAKGKSNVDLIQLSDLLSN